MDDREHLHTAWSEAWPLASLSAFDRAMVDLHTGASPDEPNRALRDDHLAWLRTRLRGASLDTIAQLQSRAWWIDHADSPRLSLADYLVSLSRRYLAHAGASITLASSWQLERFAQLGCPTDAPSIAGRWRWLSLALPQDLLVAALCAASSAPSADPPDDRVELLPTVASRLLQDPCAETHVHIGAATSFAQLWAAWIGGGIESFLAPRHALARNPYPLGGLDRFAPIATSAAIVRLLLAGFVHDRSIDRTLGFASYVRSQRDAMAGATQLDAHTLVDRAIATMLTPRDPTMDAREGARFYRRLLGRLPRRPSSHHELDPLRVLVGASQASPETIFASRAIRLARSLPDDALFLRCFWQYVRFRVQVFRWLTYEPGTAGLDWFDTFNDRLRVFSAAADASLPRLAAQHANRGLALGSLEVRTTFWNPPAASSISQALRWFARGAADAQTAPVRTAVKQSLEVGVILHFVKSAGSGSDRWDRPIAGRSVRWGRWIRQAMQQARAVRRLFETRPEMLVLLRGADLCGRELLMPSWPAVRPLVAVRAASRFAAAQLARIRPEWNVSPVSLTVHAGEDYRRPVEGIRRVHEFIDAGVLEPGDRIGHGISLADAPSRRTPIGTRTLQPLMDRLDDLVWEFDLYSRGALNAPAGRAVYVEQEILRLGQLVYGSEAASIAVQDFVRARRMRFESGVVRAAIEFGATLRDPRERSCWLLREYLESAAVFDRGEAPIEVVTDAAELAFAESVQRWLRADIAQKQITVESNPSSNHMVADLGSLDDHPALSLQPLPGRPANGPPVLLSINSDDPVVFATSLVDEYAHMYYALVRCGVSAQDAMRWIEQVRSNGYRSRFTTAVSADTAVLAAIVRGQAFVDAS